MDKKKLVILISSIVVILLLLIVGIFLIFNKDKEKPTEKPTEEVVKEEDLDKFKEVAFEEAIGKNKTQADSEIIDDEKTKELQEEMKKLDEEAKKLEEENKDKVVVTVEDTRVTKTYGDVKVTRSGGTTGNNLKQVEELRKDSGGNSVNKDLTKVNDIKYSKFTKETRPTNKNLVTNLDNKLDFVTTDISTYVFDKSNNKEEILVFTEVKSSTASKSNYDYFDNRVEIRPEYFNKSDENKENILKMLVDIGYDLTMEELKELVNKSIELKGEDLHKIRNYKAHILADFVNIMYVK